MGINIGKLFQFLFASFIITSFFEVKTINLMFFTHTVLRLYKKYRKKNTDRQKLKFFPENCQFFAEMLTGCRMRGVR